MVGNIMSIIRQTRVHDMVYPLSLSENKWDRDSNDFATTTQVQSAVAVQLILSSVVRYLSHVLQ